MGGGRLERFRYNSRADVENIVHDASVKANVARKFDCVHVDQLIVCRAYAVCV